jgi:hypothetical protein
VNPTLGEFRKITGNLPDDTYLVIMSTNDGDTHAIEDVGINRSVNVIYVEAAI